MKSTHELFKKVKTGGDFRGVKGKEGMREVKGWGGADVRS
jgi:hypothetical protein